MTHTNPRWTATGPGIMELPPTKLRIEYVAESYAPFHVTWNGLPIPFFANQTLDLAQQVAEAHEANRIAMGFEV